MTTVYAIHAADPAKLAIVKNEMAALGAPTINVIDCGDYYMAMDGSHRLAAAASLGINPVLIVHAQDEMIDISGYDFFDAANFSGTVYEAGELVGELFSATQAVPYSFNA